MVIVESRWILEGCLARMSGLLKRHYVSHSHLLIGGVVLVGSAGECLNRKGRWLSVVWVCCPFSAFISDLVRF